MSEPRKRKLLFSVTLKDCDVETFRGSGPGGQARNKVSSAVRITHRASGAVGQATERRSQHQNKVLAWERMANSKKFQAWNHVEAARRMGIKSTEERVDEAMAPHNLKTEVLDEGSKWQPVEPKNLTDEKE